MEHLKVGFITTVSGRWPRELPIARNAEYGAWLRENAGDAEIIGFDHVIDSRTGSRVPSTPSAQRARTSSSWSTVPSPVTMCAPPSPSS